MWGIGKRIVARKQPRAESLQATNKIPPIQRSGSPGTTEDELDRLDWRNHFEDPDQYEKVMREQIFVHAQSDPELQAVLHTHHLEEDRAGAFDRFLKSGRRTWPPYVIAWWGRLSWLKANRGDSQKDGVAPTPVEITPTTAPSMLRIGEPDMPLGPYRKMRENRLVKCCLPIDFILSVAFGQIWAETTPK